MSRSLPLIFLFFPLLSAHVPVSQHLPSRPGGKDYALFFAVESYDHSSSWKSLPGLTKEVESIAADLRDLYGFETKVIKNPTLAEIDAELAAWRARKFGPDDQVMVYFSGHGQFIDDRRQGYFIPSDGKGSSGSVYERQWLPYLDLRRLVTGIGCRHILLALDACFSGTADDEVVFKDETEEWAEPTGAADQQWKQQIHDQLRCQSRILLTSGGKTKTENPSKFAASFRKAFSKQGGADKIVRPSDIMEEWYGLAIPPHSTTFEGHESCGNFLFVYQPKSTPVPPPAFPDYDEDGTPDATDKCPTEAGPAATKGCPDQDGDGVADKFDRCVTEKGPASNDGCPVTIPAPAPKNVPAAAYDPMASDMVDITGGEFAMGSTEGSEDEKPVHTVEISSFRMSRYEITNAQFCNFLNEKGNQTEGGVEWINLDGKWDDERCRISKSGTKFVVASGYENYPVLYVSWYGAVAYCVWLAERTGKNYRLPTEAEWEYAAANGYRHTKYSWGDGNPSGRKGGNVADETAKKRYSNWTIFEDYTDGYVYTAPVGSFDPNVLGLYDMSGNVWEWCADWYNDKYYETSPRKDPPGPTTGSSRVCRGGSWYGVNGYCRSANRIGYNPSSRDGIVGFRVAQGK